MNKLFILISKYMTWLQKENEGKGDQQEEGRVTKGREVGWGDHGQRMSFIQGTDYVTLNTMHIE